MGCHSLGILLEHHQFQFLELLAVKAVGFGGKRYLGPDTIKYDHRSHEVSASMMSLSLEEKSDLV